MTSAEDSRAPWRGPAVAIEGRRMQRHVEQFAVVRYGVATICVTAAVIVALWLRLQLSCCSSRS